MMNVEGHRDHSVQCAPPAAPKSHRALKITAIALSALAIIGAVIATAVVLTMPLLTIIIAPVAIAAIALTIFLAKKPKAHPTPQTQTQKAQEYVPPAPPRAATPPPAQDFKPVQPLNFQAQAPVQSQRAPQPVITHESLLKNFEQGITHLNELALYLASMGIPAEVDGGSLAHLRVAVAELQDFLTKPIHQDRLVKWMDAVKECKAMQLKLSSTLLKAAISPQSLNKGMKISSQASHELSQICSFLSDHFYQIRDLKNAFVMADLVTDRNTKDQLLEKIAEAYLQAGDKENAFKTIDWVIGDRKMKDTFLLKLAESYLQEGDKANAYKMIDWVIGDRKMKDTFLLKLAESYLQEGDKANAYKMIDWVIGDRKMKDTFLLKLAESYLQEGDKANAFKMIGWVIGDRKMKDTFLLKLAESYLQEGDKKMALETASWIMGDINSKKEFIKRVDGN